MLMRTAKQDLVLPPFDLKMVETVVYGPKPQSLDKD